MFVTIFSLLRRSLILSFHVLTTIARIVYRISYPYRYFLYSILIIIFACIIEYTYLNHLYLVDEMYDITGPKELSMEEKFTIRVIAPQSTINMKKFIEVYSLCDTVHEIQFLWPNANSPPDSKTYHVYKSFISFDYSPQLSSHMHPLLIKPTLNISTEAVLFLDPDTFVTCDALTYIYSVWRSAPTSAGIGLFPRSVAYKTDTSAGGAGSSREIEYRSPYHVWAQRKYNLILQSFMMQHKSFSMKYFLDKSLKLSRVNEFLSSHHDCTEFLYYLYALSKGANKAVWTDVPFTVKSGVLMDALPSNARRSYCLTELATLLELNNLPASEHRSSPAVTHLIW